MFSETIVFILYMKTRRIRGGFPLVETAVWVGIILSTAVLFSGIGSNITRKSVQTRKHRTHDIHNIRPPLRQPTHDNNMRPLRPTARDNMPDTDMRPENNLDENNR